MIGDLKIAGHCPSCGKANVVRDIKGGLACRNRDCDCPAAARNLLVTDAEYEDADEDSDDYWSRDDDLQGTVKSLQAEVNEQADALGYLVRKVKRLEETLGQRDMTGGMELERQKQVTANLLAKFEHKLGEVHGRMDELVNSFFVPGPSDSGHGTEL